MTPIDRRTGRIRLRIERLESRNLFAADAGIGGLEVLAEPVVAAEFDQDPIAAEIDTSLSPAVFDPIDPESLVLDANRLVAEPLEEVEPISTPELLRQQQPRVAVLDESLANDAAVGTLFDTNRLVADFSIRELPLARPIPSVTDFEPRNPREEDSPAADPPASENDELETNDTLETTAS